jgi:iron complex outermembrane recepter protein
VSGWFERLPIHRKLVVMALIVTTTALALALVALVMLDLWSYRRTAAADTTALASVIAENSAAAVLFNDPGSAEETLASLRVRPAVTRACLYLEDRRLFAEYARSAERQCPALAPVRLDWAMVGATAPIVRNGQVHGTVYVERELAEVWSRFLLSVAGGGVMLLVAGVVALGIASRLNRRVSRPIVQLAAVARAMGSETPRESLRSTHAGHDEVGDLVRAFSDMLDRMDDAKMEREELLVREREANRLKDEFLAAVSHELRTPLNAIVGWAQVLSTTTVDAQTSARAIASIARNAKVQTRVIEDLVDVSRIVAGKLSLRYDPIDLRTPIEGAVDVIRPAAEGKNVTLDVQLPGRSLLINGDRDRLQQVMWNLLSNAVKFTPAGGTVTVAARDLGRFFEVAVSDSGAGIPAEFLPHVFDRFRQADGSMKREHGGLGLGLAIVKEITALHRGYVWAASKGAGQGATFTVRLPAALDGSAPVLSHIEAADAEVAPDALAGVRVLAADDNADALELLSVALTSAGAHVRGATSGAAAIEEWDREPADILLCDLAMPDTNGFDVLACIRERDSRSGRTTPAIAVSAHATEQHLARSLEAGFARHLAKPYRNRDLVRAVREVLSGASPLLLAAVAAAWLATPAAAQTTRVPPTGLVAQPTAIPRPTVEELKRRTLEELMDLPVSTASRAPERTIDVPAAVHVITQDDIRRSGAVSLPEILRLAPGLQVARIDSARYAVGIRGFADRLARSMLVLIDGRAVYSPLFAGTYWEVQDTMLEDIDRIEVIRGPGGTLWGANAVNGIINIITKPAADTQGTLVSARLGPEARGPGAVRYGGTAGDRFRYRLYGKGVDRDGMFPSDGDRPDDWRMFRGGFRGDWSLAGARTATVQGDVYTAELAQRVTLTTFAPPFREVFTRRSPLSGGHLLGRWTGRMAGGEFQLKSYYDRTRRDERPVAETRGTFDVDFQHARAVAARHRLVWGLGYRATTGTISAIGPAEFAPNPRTDRLYSAFAQDDFTIVPDRLRFVVGAKLEHNADTGFELQPSARLGWTLNPSHTLVWSVARAVRTPSRVETDYMTTSLADPAVPAFTRLVRNPDFEPEELIAYEMGYRTRPWRAVYLTISAFYNRLDRLLSIEPLPPFVEEVPPPSKVILPLILGNGIRGNSYGFEITGDWRPAPWWRWTANYSHLRIDASRRPGSQDVSRERVYEGFSPRHQVHVHSSVDLPRGVELDWLMRYVSELPGGPVPAYRTSDLRLAWRVTPRLALAAVGKNLNRARHIEWWSSGGLNVEVERRGFVSLTWRP